MYDLLIINGEILDGSGQAPYAADIGIQKGRIASIAPRIEAARGRHVIDAAGLKVCPGFIDMHSHTDFTILTNPRAESKVRQGITTEVVGNCGFSAAPVRREHFQDLMDYLVNTVALTEEGKKHWLWPRQSDYMAEIAQKGTAVNLASLVGHGTIRVAVMGFAQRPPSPCELSQMVRLLEDELDQGIWGFSTGLQYDPGSFAALEELVELATVTARRGGLYTTHMKSEGSHLLECLAQSLAVAEKSGVSLQVSHLKAENPDNWGKTAEALQLLDAARAAGINVDFDLYPYTAFGSGLMDLLPPWAREEGVGKMTELLKREAGRKKVLADMARPAVGEWQTP
jgi:N-acyl-D-amino-acid deacylase